MSALKEQLSLVQSRSEGMQMEQILNYKSDSDIFENIKGESYRGKYKTSKDEACPRCGSKDNVFVILDFLFLDLPFILHTLLRRGKAVLWSSQESVHCKDAPMFLCRGKCPSDPKRSGFNVNWNVVDLGAIYFPEYVAEPQSLVDAETINNNTDNTVSGSEEEPKFVGLLPKAKNTTGLSCRDRYQVVLEGDVSLAKVELSDDNSCDASTESETEEMVDDFDDAALDFDYYKTNTSWVALDEEVYDSTIYDSTEADALVLTMLALEAAKKDWAEGTLHTVECHVADTPACDDQEKGTPPLEPVQTNGTTIRKNASDIKLGPLPKSSSGKKQKFPISKDGACPHCSSKDVIYIVLMYKDNCEDDLPPILLQLLRLGHAIQMEKGDSEPPSFQCNGCSYGFNLDWSSCSLESIFLSSLKNNPLPSPQPMAHPPVVSFMPQAMPPVPGMVPPPMCSPVPVSVPMPHAFLQQPYAQPPITIPPPQFNMSPPVPMAPYQPMQAWPNMGMHHQYWQDPYYNQNQYHTSPNQPPGCGPPPDCGLPPGCGPSPAYVQPPARVTPSRKQTYSVKWVAPQEKDTSAQYDMAPPGTQSTVTTSDAMSAPGTDENAEINFVAKSS